LTVNLNFEGKFNAEFGEDSSELELTFEVVSEIFPDFLDVGSFFFLMEDAVEIDLDFIKILNVLFELGLDIEGDAFNILFFILGS
jgi:hypothetical protein